MFSTTEPSSSSSSLFKAPIPNAALKRNTACHQCRRRKLKCDAKRPCTTCLRSHSYAIAHAPSGVIYPELPECTFDDVEPETQPPRSKYERLENRIGELESLLREMTSAMQTSQAQSNAPSPGSMTSTGNGAASSPRNNASNSETNTRDNSPGLTPGHMVSVSETRDSGTGTFSFPSPFTSVQTIQTIPSPADQNTLISTQRPDDYQVFPVNWPAHLPLPEVTRHLVHAFFAFNMYAGRLFHGPTFMSSLDFHPSDPKFPTPAVLHAMCAVGSLYTAEIPPTPIHTSNTFPYEIFAGRWRRTQTRPDSFAEQQIKLAKMALEDMIDTGARLVEGLQALNLLTWFYICQARWSEAALAAGLTLRCAIPCGLTISAPFTCATPSMGLSSLRSAAVLPPPQSIVDAETRRNIFWIAYSMERQIASGNSHSQTLDDLDIYQLLPVRGDQFEQGMQVPIKDRQWSHDVNMLVTHPKPQTDSFVLYIKAMTLLSHVKVFTVRYKGRYYAGDPTMYSANGATCNSLDELDPRDTVAFQEIDHLVSSFKASFPSHLRDPIHDEMVDPYLYSACIASHMAQIRLHEPFADLKDATCVSVNKVLTAARSIMDLIYKIASTSYDVSLLDFLPYLGWFIAGRVLVRCLQVAIDTSNFEQLVVLQTEVSFVHTMLAKAGERMPVAYRYKRIIYDLLSELCGQEFVEPLPASSVPFHKLEPIYMPPTNSSFHDPMPAMLNLFTTDISPSLDMHIDDSELSALLGAVNNIFEQTSLPS